MINYTSKTCRHCERVHSCDYPCEDYRTNENDQKDMKIINVNVDHLTPEKKEEILNLIEKYSGRLSDMDMSVSSYDCDEQSDNDISNFLEYGVENVEWLRCLNGQISILEFLDKNAIRDYLEEKNRLFCEENGLCERCRNPLKRYEQIEEYWGSKQVVGYEYRCEFGCS